jgi:hypothetical protein
LDEGARFLYNAFRLVSAIKRLRHYGMLFMASSRL